MRVLLMEDDESLALRRIAELHGGTVAAVPRRGDQAGCLEVVLPARG